MARFNDSGMPLKYSKNVPLGIYCTQIWPIEHNIVAVSDKWLDILGYRDSRHDLWWQLANWEFGYGNVEFDDKRSTPRPDSLVLLRKIPSGKSFNWLFSGHLQKKRLQWVSIAQLKEN